MSAEIKEIFLLYDEDLDGKIDATQIGDVCRAAGLNITNAQVIKAAGEEYKRKGQKRLTFEEFAPIYETLVQEKPNGTHADFLEGLKMYDPEETGKILGGELRHALLALGERLDREQIDEIMKGVEDAEGKVNYDAFITKVLSNPIA